jgi:hypothetical protein
VLLSSSGPRNVTVFSNSVDGVVTLTVRSERALVPYDGLPIACEPAKFVYTVYPESTQTEASIRIANIGDERLRFEIVEAPFDLMDFTLPIHVAAGDTVTLTAAAKPEAQGIDILKSITIDIEEYR